MTRRSIALILTSLCVASAAGAAHAGAQPADIGGRWHNEQIWMLARSDASCDNGGCGLTLDIVACGDSFCGIEVGTDNTCGATALKFDSGKTRVTEHADGVLFAGNLELARGTEPYVVEAFMRPAGEGAPAELSISGDTGGEFRAFRRSFPFHATLARTGEATCKLDKPVS